jgi:(S)-ureidoglycine aminohydrolase
VTVLAAPAMGARFVQYLIDLPAGKRGDFAPDDDIETFYYVLAGTGQFLNGHGIERPLAPGSFGLTPPTRGTSITATEPVRLLVLRKRYEPAPAIPLFDGIYDAESRVPALPWADSEHMRLQTLIPDDFAYDLAMNIFTFDPGYGLPIVETHVMEHGALILQGKGVYYLDGDWMEVEAGDFIWMGPFCPQSFYATGPVPAKYIYYKNVNRDIQL